MNNNKLKGQWLINYTLLLCVGLFCYTPVFAAETVKKTEAVVLPDNPPILSVVTGDWNADKLLDSAILLRSGDQADLYIYLNKAEGEMELKLYKKNGIWTGALAGTKPYLQSLPKDNALYIYSENDAIGRNRWHQRLTVIYNKEAEFVIAGLSYDSIDTLKPDAEMSCEVDFITGAATKNKKPFKVKAKKLLLNNWADGFAPATCKE